MKPATEKQIIAREQGAVLRQLACSAKQLQFLAYDKKFADTERIELLRMSADLEKIDDDFRKRNKIKTRTEY